MIIEIFSAKIIFVLLTSLGHFFNWNYMISTFDILYKFLFLLNCTHTGINYILVVKFWTLVVNWVKVERAVIVIDNFLTCFTSYVIKPNTWHLSLFSQMASTQYNQFVVTYWTDSWKNSSNKPFAQVYCMPSLHHLKLLISVH